MDIEKINAQWGEILAAARKHPDMQKQIAFDDVGAIIITPDRPMIESMICDKATKNERLLFYLALLGFHHAPGRVLQVGVRSKMPMGTGGKGEKKKR